MRYDAVEGGKFVINQIRKLTRDSQYLAIIMDVKKCMVSFSNDIKVSCHGKPFQMDMELIEKRYRAVECSHHGGIQMVPEELL